MSVVRIFERFISIAGHIVVWLTILPIAFFSLLQMLDRKLKLGVSTVLPDISTALLFIMIMMLFGFTYLRDGHVRVDVLRRNWSKEKLAVIEIVGAVLILLPLCVILVKFGWDGLMRTTHYADNDVWAMRIASIIGPAFLGIAGITVIMRNIEFLRGKSGSNAPTETQSFDNDG